VSSPGVGLVAQSRSLHSLEVKSRRSVTNVSPAHSGLFHRSGRERVFLLHHQPQLCVACRWRSARWVFSGGCTVSEAERPETLTGLARVGLRPKSPGVPARSKTVRAEAFHSGLFGST